ncbi:helix-turn-helix transcriptional regulator [Christensenellaceae bacterium OttesenSCG-928-K19]|nr:helix-turn-helix transcriptional regulator [Christensenellaceae bacterium OttesenSCG-928-K19]
MSKHATLEPEGQIANAMISGRNEKGMTQKNLAYVAGTSLSHISRLENGNANPTIIFLKRIAAGLEKELHIEFR